MSNISRSILKIKSLYNLTEQVACKLTHITLGTIKMNCGLPIPRNIMFLLKWAKATIKTLPLLWVQIILREGPSNKKISNAHVQQNIIVEKRHFLLSVYLLSFQAFLQENGRLCFKYMLLNMGRLLSSKNTSLNSPSTMLH